VRRLEGVRVLVVGPTPVDTPVAQLRGDGANALVGLQACISKHVQQRKKKSKVDEEENTVF